MRDRDALRRHDTARNDRRNDGPELAFVFPGQAIALVRETEERARLRMVDVEDERVAAFLLHALVGERGALVAHAAPAAKGPHEFRHFSRQAEARRAETDAAPLLHPAVGVEQALEQREACGARSIPIDARDELVVARN